MPANLENSAVATGLEKVSFHSNPKDRYCRRVLKLVLKLTFNIHALISPASKVMLKILQAQFHQFSSAQSLSHVQLFVTPWTSACQASLSITNSRSLLKLMSIESVMTSNHLILCCPLLLPPSIFPGIRVFSNESVLHIKWPKYWSFSFSISLSNEHSGLTLEDGLVGSPCSPRDSQESSPTAQFKSINSLVLSFLYSPTLTFIHDYWKNHISMWIKNFQIYNLDLQKADEPEIKLPTFVGL